jgi:hypothetical protein
MMQPTTTMTTTAAPGAMQRRSTKTPTGTWRWTLVRRATRVETTKTSSMSGGKRKSYLEKDEGEDAEEEEESATMS